MLIDPETDFGKRVLHRLQQEQVIWLTTVASDGTPQPNPVWFWWDGETFLIYTRPIYKKVANLKKRPRVSLHFDATPSGEDVVVFNGTAQFDLNAPPVHQNPQYVDKYRQGLASLGSSPEQMGAEYSTAVRIKPDKVRGW